MEDPFEQDINKFNKYQDDNIVQEITPSTPLDENKNETSEINNNDEEVVESEEVLDDEEGEEDDKIKIDEKSEIEDKVEEISEVIEVKVTQSIDEEVEAKEKEESIVEDLEKGKEEVKEEEAEAEIKEEKEEEMKVEVKEVEIEEFSEESEDKEVNDEEKTEDQVPDITATDGGDLMTTSMDGIDDIPEEEIKMPVEGGPVGDEPQVVVDEDVVVPTTPSDDIKEVVVEEVKEETNDVVEEKVEETVEEKPADVSESKEEEVKVEVMEEKKEEVSVDIAEEKKEDEPIEVVEEKIEEQTVEVVEEKKDDIIEEKKEEIVEEKKDEVVEEKKEEVIDEVVDEKAADSSVAPSEHEFELQPPPTPKRKETPCELDNLPVDQEQESSKVEVEEAQTTPKATTPAADGSVKGSVPPTPINEESVKESVSEAPAADESAKELISEATPKEESVKEEVPATPIVEVSVKEEVPLTPAEESVKESISEAPASEATKDEPVVATPKISVVSPPTPKTSISTPKTPATPKRSVSKSGATPRSKKSTSKFQFDDVSDISKKDSVSETPNSAKLSVSGTPAEIISESSIAEEPKEAEAPITEEVVEAPPAESEPVPEDSVKEESIKEEPVEESQTEEVSKKISVSNETEIKESNDDEVKVEEKQDEESKDEELKVEDSEKVRKVSYREPEAEINETPSAISSSRRDTSQNDEGIREPPTRNYQPYDQDSHRIAGPTKLQSNSSFSSWMPTESASYTPKSPYVLNTAHKYKTEFISSYRPPSSFYTTMFDDIVSTGPFNSSLYATNRLLERSRSRTRERKSALRNIRSSSNYTKYISAAPSPMRTREYSTPPSRELSRAPSRSGSFISFMEYSGAKQYELARDNSRNNIYNGLYKSASRGDVDLYAGSGRLSRVDSYVSKMNHNYDYDTPRTYSMYRSTSRPNISYTPSYPSYNSYYGDNDSTLSRMKRYARETVNPTGYRSMYEVSIFPRLHQMRQMSLYNTYYPNITNPFLLTHFPNPHLYHYQLQGYVGELQRSLSREKFKNDRLRSQYTKVSHQLEQACKQMDLLRTNSYSLCRSGSAPRCSVYSHFYPYY